MAMLKIKKGDRVVVLAGKDKGRRGEVMVMIPKENRAVVQGVNVVRRHQKQSPSQEGGVIAREAPIDLSNLALEDPRDGEPTRVGFKRLEDGTKVRYAKKSGEIIHDKR
jgi:large subunit ribosomal protein L24